MVNTLSRFLQHLEQAQTLEAVNLIGNKIKEKNYCLM